MTVTINGTTGVAGVDGTAGTPSYQGNDSNTGIFFPAADTIAFTEGGVEVARFNSSGNLGIGTSSPTTKLEINVPGAEGINLNTAGSLDSPRIFFTNSNGGGSACVINNANNALRFATGGTAGASSGTERMRINPTGSREFNTFNTGNINTGETTIEWGNVTSTTFDITTLFPNVLGLGSGVGIIIQLQTWTGSPGTGTSVIGSGARGNSSWAWTTVNNTNTGGGPTVTFSASGNVVTISFSFGAQYGKAKISLIATS
jgi:hypothetical protein